MNPPRLQPTRDCPSRVAYWTPWAELGGLVPPTQWPCATRVNCFHPIAHEHDPYTARCVVCGEPSDRCGSYAGPCRKWGES